MSFNKNNSDILYANVKTLSNYEGSIIFGIGDYYIQFAKDKNSDLIYFEAVSHNFLDLLPLEIKTDFLNLGFTIDDGNYYKSFKIEDLENIVSDSQKIFENIYKVNYNKSFKITDDILYPTKFTNTDNSSNENINTNQLSNPKNTNSGIVILVLLILIIGYMFVFYSNSNSSKTEVINTEQKEIEEIKKEAFFMAQRILEKQLLSPKNSEFGLFDNSKIVDLGNNRYQILNYVDAPNVYGTPIRNTYYIILKYKGGAWGNMNNWYVEDLKIE